MPFRDSCVSRQELCVKKKTHPWEVIVNRSQGTAKSTEDVVCTRSQFCSHSFANSSWLWRDNVTRLQQPPTHTIRRFPHQKRDKTSSASSETPKRWNSDIRLGYAVPLKSLCGQISRSIKERLFANKGEIKQRRHYIPFVIGSGSGSRGCDISNAPNPVKEIAWK